MSVPANVIATPVCRNGQRRSLPLCARSVAVHAAYTLSVRLAGQSERCLPHSAFPALRSVAILTTRPVAQEALHEALNWKTLSMAARRCGATNCRPGCHITSEQPRA
eukprot:2836973-Prymnesium_polylepis.1